MDQKKSDLRLSSSETSWKMSKEDYMDSMREKYDDLSCILISKLENMSIGQVKKECDSSKKEVKEEKGVEPSPQSQGGLKSALKQVKNEIKFKSISEVITLD